MTLKVYEVRDRFDGEAEITSVFDKAQTFEARSIKSPLISGGAVRRIQKADVLIVSDCWNLHLRSSGKFADGIHNPRP